jgi:hypothetical protein
MRPLSPENTRWLRLVLPILLGALGVAAALTATWLNLAQAQDDASLELGLASTGAQTGSDGLPLPVDLPAYRIADQGGLSRLANPHTTIPTRQRVDVVRYTVQPGDSVFGIAEKFSIQPETVLWGNYDVLNDDPHLLRPGQELNILPVDGTYYQWKDGDTLQGVAGYFHTEPQEIADWPGNHLDPQSPEIPNGAWLVVPGGKRELRTWVVPTIARGFAGVGTAFGPGGCSGDFSSGAVGTGGFIWPTGNHYISGNDYWAGHLAIDIAAGEGAPIWAADTGVVVYAGWSNGGYGNMVMIDHGNGWQTLYAHLSVVSVRCGSNIGQGQGIGLGGSTGNSTGPHLHFETRYEGGFVNPWYVLP